MIKNLSRRIERLEEMVVPKHGPRAIYIMPNLEEEEPEEGPGLVKLSSSLWAHIWGAPLTADEIRKLKEEYKEDRNEPETKN
jgi:hypothetical protein